MLARLSSSETGLLSSFTSPDDLSDMSPGEESLILDMDTFRLVLPIPDIHWRHVAELCERAVNPMCKGLYSALNADLERVAQVLAALDIENECGEAESESSAAMKNTRNFSLSTPQPLIIRSPDSAVPTIVITPCSPQPRESSCQVPYQDSAFRSRLTVPSQPSLNQSFPPMISPLRYRTRGIHHWIWKNGHWQAAVGGLEPRPRVLKSRKKRPGKA
ncbi:hypothetical protein C8J57DRAFT_8176 [Mycena rebaudengoi]|nr:hypothetical protein C8J57DRAFT_8176 [Mycena rebaudengoi]